MSKNKSHHILSTSSNLLGFCLIVLTSLKITKFNEVSWIDEFTGVACILLGASSLFSFLSMRAESEKYADYFEKIADYIFAGALFIVVVITFMIAFSVIF